MDSHRKWVHLVIELTGRVVLDQKIVVVKDLDGSIRQYHPVMTMHIELRLCVDQVLSNEDIFVDLAEIWVM